jgi:hypothetical protein
MTLSASSGGTSYPRFKAQPYVPDGGASITGSMLLMVVLLLFGAALGFVAHLVRQYFYLILIFPALIGLALGAVGVRIVRKGKIRNPLLGGVAGFVGGAAAMLAIHYFDFLEFKNTISKLDPQIRELAKLPKAQREEAIALARDPGAAREVLEAAAVETFPQFMDYSAKQGVEIKSSHSFSSREKGMNLGYVGSYIYWGAELLIVAGITFAMVRSETRQPYCCSCNEWKPWRKLGILAGPRQPAAAGVSSGEVNDVAAAKPGAFSGNLHLWVAGCQCNRSTAEVKLEELSYDKKNNVSRKTVALASWPLEAVAVLEELFVRKPAAALSPQQSPQASGES